jgi:signal transduction histidine kinase
MDVRDLRAVSMFDGLSDDQLSELMDAADEVPFETGDVLFREGEPADSWWVLLAGELELVRRLEHGEGVVAVMSRPGLWAGGFRAWTEAAGYLATGRAATSGRMLRVPSPVLGDRVRAWFPFGVHLIEGFFQTVRSMEALSRQREALLALGGLAAGLAHEINNPASAAVRAVQALEESCESLLSSLVDLAERSLRAEQFVGLDALRRELDTASAATIDPLALADSEEALLAWLESHDVAAGWSIASALAAAGVDLGWCERASRILDRETLEPGLLWVASTLSMASQLMTVRDSTSRISALVADAKIYSQVDRASFQVIDVSQGIASTLSMLAHKLPDGVKVIREFSHDAPTIEAYPGELNQVWTNLINNAVDAIGENGEVGTLRISTRAENGGVLVEIADTGPGMPPDVQARAFEPFYTTKDVGKGTGLGLDISRRIIVQRHHGQISIDRRDGETVFSVWLPQHS